MKDFQIIRIENKLNSIDQNVIMNFIWQNQVIGEIELSSGDQPANHDSNEFLTRLSESPSLDSFREEILQRASLLSVRQRTFESNIDY